MSTEIREQLSTVETPEPLVDATHEHTDIVSQGLVGEITVDGDTASVPLALGAPYSPAETELAAAVRETLEAAGYTPELSVAIDDETPASEGPIVIAVSSGKGGVGKSTIAVNLAAGIADRGATVGLFDTDVYGPNIPRMLGVQGEPVRGDQNQRIVPVEAHGMKLMSVGFLVDEEMPVIWRGSMVDQTLTELWHEVNWGQLDYLVVDLPPGTGDAQLTRAAERIEAFALEIVANIAPAIMIIEPTAENSRVKPATVTEPKTAPAAEAATSATGTSEPASSGTGRIPVLTSITST